jgi:hypothetical protein
MRLSVSMLAVRPAGADLWSVRSSGPPAALKKSGSVEVRSFDHAWRLFDDDDDDTPY